MGQIRRWLTVAGLLGVMLPGCVLAQNVVPEAVAAAAKSFAERYEWHPQTLLTADFDCTGKVQFAMLGTSMKEVAVAIFTNGLDHPPSLIRFDSDAQQIIGSKIRLDDYNLTADEITGVSGTAPAGYRQSTTCHGVRLSDETSNAAHIYWDHEHKVFDSWVQ